MAPRDPLVKLALKDPPEIPALKDLPEIPALKDPQARRVKLGLLELLVWSGPQARLVQMAAV